MSEKDKVDWNKLTQEPCPEEVSPERKQEPAQKSVDWALLTRENTRQEGTQSNIETELQKKQKEQRIDWAKLTKSPKR